MSEAGLLAILIGVVLFACVSDLARAGRFTAPMMFAGLGLGLGPLALDVVQVDLNDAFVERLAELALVTALFTNAARIDLRRLHRFHSLPLRLLGIGLPLTIMAGTLVAWWLFDGLGFWAAALLAIILGPTDAALSEPVVASDEVPALIRQGLNVETGLNDGLGLPCLLIAAALASGGPDAGQGAGSLAVSLALPLLGGPAIGAAVALLAGWAIGRPLRRGWVGRDYNRLALVVLPVIAYFVAEMAGANGFLSAFASGLVISTRPQDTLDEVETFNGTVEQFFNATVFFLVGVLFLPQYLPDVGWRNVAFAVLALTVLRMGPVALSTLGLKLQTGTILFLGWFGPRGMASVIYLLIVIQDFGVPGIDDIAATVAFTVALSIVAHGLTAAPGTRRYRDYAGARKAEDEDFPGQRASDRRADGD